MPTALGNSDGNKKGTSLFLYQAMINLDVVNVGTISSIIKLLMVSYKQCAFSVGRNICYTVGKTFGNIIMIFPVLQYIQYQFLFLWIFHYVHNGLAIKHQHHGVDIFTANI